MSLSNSGHGGSITTPSGVELQTADVQHLMQLLRALTQPNTETIRQAESALKPILKQYTSMELLWYVITTATNDATISPLSPSDAIAVRHVATIVLRKRLPGHYASLHDAARQRDWQTRILQALAVETVRPVRTGLLGVAATLAAQDAEQPPPPVLQFLMAASASTEPTARALCFQLLEEMTDSIGTHWKERVQDLFHLYHSVLANAQEVAMVQCHAVKALGQLLSFWVDDEEEMAVLSPLLPLFLQVAAQHAQAPTSDASHANEDDDDLLSTVLDVLYDISYSTAASLTQHFALMVQFSLSCLQAKHLSLRVRDAAALVIATLAESKSKLFGRSTALLGAVLDALFQLMQDSPASAAGALFESNPAWRQDLEDATDIGDGDDDDFDAPTETSMAQGTLDMMACEIPKKYIWPAGIQRCLAYMNQEGNAAARKAGVAGLGVMAEGCAEPLTAALPEIMPYIFRACADQSPQVRECACFCLGQISEHCQPDILQYSTQVLPIIFALLDDGSVAVQATSCYVLEMFCERLEPAAVRPVLDQLVRKLAAMLESTTTKRSVQEMAVAAMAATAVAAEEEFVPYVAVVAAFMVPRMAIRTESLYSLRGRALECMGHIAIAVGKEHFRPYFPITMQSAMEGLTLDSTELQEFAYAVFANLAKVMGDEFAPALKDLVPFLIQVIEQDEGQFERRADDNKADGFTGLDDSDNDDDDEDEDGNLVLHVRTALLEVKKGAITALGEMAAHTGTLFCPYIESSMQVMQKAASNWHPLIKTEAADAMPSLIVPSIAAYHNGAVEWKKGDVTGALHGPPLSQHTATIAHAVLLEEIALMKDDESATVAKAAEAVQSVIEICGPTVIMPVLNEILSATHELLIQVAPCQSNDAQLYDTGHGDVDDDDHDATTQAACDLIGSLCRVLGSQVMGPYMSQFLPPIKDYAKSSRPTADRAMAIGCLGEIAQEFDDEVGIGILQENWSTIFLPCILSTLPDRENDHVQRNAAFCAGVCAEALKDRMSMQDCQTLLQHLGPLFTERKAPGTATESAMACVDNAAAAVARIIMSCPPTYVPLGQVLPVLLSALPLQTDMTENETVYKCLMGLLQMINSNADVQASRNDIHRVLTLACQADSNVEEELRAKIRSALSAVGAQ